MKKTWIPLLLLVVLVAVLAFVAARYRGPSQNRPTGVPATKEQVRQAEDLQKRPGVDFSGYPDDFPQDLAVLPAVFDQALRTKLSDGRSAISVTFKTGNARENIVDLYRTQLSGKGWAVFESQPSEDETLLRVTKGGQRADVAVAATGTGQSQVQVLVYLSK